MSFDITSNTKEEMIRAYEKPTVEHDQWEFSMGKL
jgi:hypothetical protein